MMQDDPPQDELDESQSESSDVDDGDAVDISGIEIETGNTDGGDSNEVEEPPQSLVLGDSLPGEIEPVDLGDIFVDEGLASPVIETDEPGSVSAKDSGFLLPSEVICDPFGLDFEIKPWDIDLEEFMDDVEEDPDAATMLGAANEFDPDAGDSLQDEPEESQSESCDIYENDVLFQGQGIEDSPSKGILNEAINELISLGFYGFILIVICAIFLICMFLGYV